jgi:zinc protease
VNPPSGQVTKVVKKGTEDKATVTLLVSGTYKPSDLEELNIQALGDILNIKLTEKLREEEGGVYSPYVRGSASRVPSPRYQFRIGFGCSPANVDKLVALTLAEIEKFKSSGATQVDIDKFVTKQKLDFQSDLKSNDFWLNELADKYQKGEDVKSILEEGKLLDKLSIQSTKETAQKYMSGKDMIKVILLPEDKK